MSSIPVSVYATQADYELWVGNQEAVEATNPDDVTATTVNAPKLQQALDLAASKLVAADGVACPPGKYLIRSQFKLLQIFLTRWVLDTLKQREDIKEGYEQVQAVIEASYSDDVCSQELDISSELALELGLEDSVPVGVTSSHGGRIWTRTSLSGFQAQPFIGR